MTRARSARRKRAAGAGGTRPAGAWVPIAVAIVVTAAIALGIGIWRRQAGPGPGSGLSPGTLRDSLRAAEARRDWVAGLAWAERLATAMPRDVDALRDLSVAWHNRATVERPSPTGPRPALRNSIERAECETRAFALADSAASVALSVSDWASVEAWRGQVIEYLGLPADALSTYDALLQRQPDNGGARLRLNWLLAHLRDPQAPDRIQVSTGASDTP
jgi:hypothetical protein